MFSFADLQKLKSELDISMVVPGCSGGQDMSDFPSSPSLGVTSDAGGLSSHPQSPAKIKEENPPSDPDSDSRTEPDSGGMLSDGDQARKTKRRRLGMSSTTAQTIVDIQRSLQYSVDRLKQQWLGISSMDQHLGGVTNSIQELVGITNILEAALGQNIQSNEHRGWDSNIANNHRSQPALSSHPQDHLSTNVHLHEAVATDDRDGVPGVSVSVSAGVAQRETNQTAFPNQDDEEELYGRYIAAAIRKLTDRSRSRAKLKIQQVIFRLQEVDGGNNSH